MRQGQSQRILECGEEETHEDDVMASLHLLGRYTRELPSLGHSVRSIHPLSFPSGRVHVRIEHVHLAHPFNVDADPTDSLSGKEVSFDKVERVAVEGVGEDE